MDVARMSEAHVPEPGTMEGPSRQDLLHIYEQTGTIAIVGASADERKAAHVIPSYLQSQGYRIIPVNTKGGEIFGEHVYPSLEEIDAPVDVVDVFRPPAEADRSARVSRTERIFNPRSNFRWMPKSRQQVYFLPEANQGSEIRL